MGKKKKGNSDTQVSRLAHLVGAALFFLLLVPVISFSAPSTLDDFINLGWHQYNTGKLDDAFNTFLSGVEKFPESPELHLALGQIYIEKGIIGKGREHLIKSLSLDDSTSRASTAHFLLAKLIREEDPSQALLHLYRALELGGSQTLLLNVAKQIRFCNLILTNSSVAESRVVKLHFAPYLISQDEADSLAELAEADCFLAETFTGYTLEEKIHVFLYPSERAIRAEIRTEEEESDPENREYHIVYYPNLDFMEIFSDQIIWDLQKKLNRHAGSNWVNIALPYAIRGRIPWHESAGNIDQSEVPVDIDDAVRSMLKAGIHMKLEYLINPGYYEYIDPIYLQAELGCFLKWVKFKYPTFRLQEIITQPNLTLILMREIPEIEKLWLDDLQRSKSLISDTMSADLWAKNIPISPLAGNPEIPVQVLKEGLSLYLQGSTASGLREIRRALDMDPSMGLGYYTLGWIEIQQDNPEKAEEYLSKAVLLLVSPVEIAWCHSFLSPIYLHNQRWNEALASLTIVINGIDSEEVKTWAEQMYAIVNHIIALKPNPPLPRDSEQFLNMTEFMQKWNLAVNQDKGVSAYISEVMDSSRNESLKKYYSSIKKEFPLAIFNHAVTSVGVSGSAILIETRVQLRITGSGKALPPHLLPLAEGGLLRYFQVMPSDKGWKIIDYEDGWFPYKTGREGIFGKKTTEGVLEKN